MAFEIPHSAPPCSDISGTVINTCTQFWKSLFTKHRDWKVWCYHDQLLSRSKPSAAWTVQFWEILWSSISILSSANDGCWVITMWPYPAPVWTWICFTRLDDDPQSLSFFCSAWRLAIDALSFVWAKHCNMIRSVSHRLRSSGASPPVHNEDVCASQCSPAPSDKELFPALIYITFICVSLS